MELKGQNITPFINYDLLVECVKSYWNTMKSCPLCHVEIRQTCRLDEYLGCSFENFPFWALGICFS